MIVLPGVGEKRGADRPARVVGGHDPKMAGPFHPPRVAVETLPDEGAVASRPPVLVDHLHIGPVERGELAIVHERPKALILLGGHGRHQVDLLKKTRRGAHEHDGRHGAVLKQKAQAHRIVFVMGAGSEPEPGEETRGEDPAEDQPFQMHCLLLGAGSALHASSRETWERSRGER